jgi:hypothetical protein
MTFVATIAKADLSSRVDVTSKLIDFSGAVKYLASGEWNASLPASTWDRLSTDWPVQWDETGALIRNDAPLLFALRWTDKRLGVILSGPILEVSRERMGGVESVKLSGVDEWGALFGSRTVWPQPTSTTWTTSAYHSITAQASSAIAELITQHVGPGALTRRQVPGTTVVDAGFGEVRTWQYRLAELESAVSDIATGEGLQVDVRRGLDGELTVTIGPTQNRTNIVINEAKLDDFAVTLSMGAATTVIAGGSGEGTSRLFSIAGDEVTGAARRELFTDQRNISSQPTLDAAAAALLAANSASASLSGTLLPDVPVMWRDHYELGDLLTLQVEGTRWPAQVTAVTVQIDANGLHVSPVLGKATRFVHTQLIRDVSGIGARLSTLEVS